MLLQMVERRCFPRLPKSSPHCSQKPGGGLCLKMASLLKFSKPCFPKMSAFLCELRLHSDDSTDARVPGAVISVIICV